MFAFQKCYKFKNEVIMTIELIQAAAKGDVTTIHALLNPYTVHNQLLIKASRFPDVNFQEKYYGNTALHYALQGKHFDVADALINYGAAQNVTNFRGLTPVELYHEFYTLTAIEDNFQQQQTAVTLTGTVEVFDKITPFDPYGNEYSYL